MKKHVHTFKYMHSVWKSQKVAFNIASEASDVYTLSGQKSIKNGQFGKFLKTWSFLSNSVTRQSLKIRQKLLKIAKNETLKSDILSNFRILWDGIFIEIQIQNCQLYMFLDQPSSWTCWGVIQR